MKQIKTVIKPFINADDFDAQVNRLISAGWTLKNREITEESQSFHPHFMAYLEKGDEAAVIPESVRTRIAELEDFEARMNLLPRCETCGVNHTCPYCPKPGEHTRYNCPLWRKRG